MVKVWTFYNINIDLPSFNIWSLHVSEDSLHVSPHLNVLTVLAPVEAGEEGGLGQAPASARVARVLLLHPGHVSRDSLHGTRGTAHLYTCTAAREEMASLEPSGENLTQRMGSAPSCNTRVVTWPHSSHV